MHCLFHCSPSHPGVHCKLSPSVASVTRVRAACGLRAGEKGATGDPHPQAGRACPSQEQGGRVHGAQAQPSASGTSPGMGRGQGRPAVGPTGRLALAAVGSWRLAAGTDMGPGPWAGWGRPWGTTQGQGGRWVPSAPTTSTKAALPHTAVMFNLLFFIFFQLVQIWAGFFCDGHGHIPT